MTGWDKKVVKDGIFDLITPFLKSQEFKAFKGSSKFIRKTESGHQQIGINLSHYHPQYYIKPFFGLRIHETEDMIQQVVFMLDKYKKDSLSWISREGITGFDGYFIANNVNDLQEFYIQFKDWFMNQAAPKFKQLNTIIKINQYVNHSEYDEVYPNDLIFTNWPLYKIIFAKLAGDSEYDQVVKKVTNDMKRLKYNEQGTEEFNKLKSIFERL